MPRPWVRARAYATHLWVLSGPEVGRLVTEVTGRAPMYSRSLKGWTMQEPTAEKVLALADHERRSVTLEDYRDEPIVDLSPPRETVQRVGQFDERHDQLELGFGDAS